MLHRVALAASLLLFVSLAASQPSRPSEKPEIERIATVGHGLAFDSKMRPIPIDLKTIRAMQDSLRRVLAKTRLTGQPGIQSFAARVESATAQSRSEEEKAMLTGVLIRRQLESADKRLRTAYDWRNNFLIERSRALLDRRSGGRYQLSDMVLRLLREGGLLIITAIETGYMGECRAQNVPVPPNFSMSKPGAWVRQGNLTYNMLDPGDPAEVWTWTDPARRGACVALPRDDGGPGTFAGIICQSASTGKACFWDNLTRANPTRRIPAATETMVIRDLQDGKTLDVNAPCTECHTGNNVYLMSPDDPTWAKLLRGALPATNYSTVFEPQAATVAGGPRYTPIAHAIWVNPALTIGCSGSCHAAPSTSVQNLWSALPAAQRPPMPPTCATGGDFRNCYDTP